MLFFHGLCQCWAHALKHNPIVPQLQTQAGNTKKNPFILECK